MEDLWAFNEECVARAVYDSQIPVISAVGHEPDVTIADFTADLRAATPSNAAELAVPDQNEVYAALASLGARMEQASRQRLLRERQRLERLRESRVMADPRRYFQEKRLLLDYQSRRLGHGLSASVSGQRERFARLAAALDALSPLKVLGRGYAIAQKKGRERDRLGPGRLPRGALFPAAVGRTGGGVWCVSGRRRTPEQARLCPRI